MKFTSLVLTGLFSAAAANSMPRLRQLAQILGEQKSLGNGRKLQLSESYGFNSWGDEGTSVFDAVQDTDPVDDPPMDDAEGTMAPTPTPLPGLYDIIANSSDHTTLLSALEMAYLAEPLMNTTGPLTIFAPINEAFAAIANESAPYFRPEYVYHLMDILAYHVVEAKVMSTDLEETNITMGNMEGANITLDPPMINDATIIAADVEASNGVLHVVDTVLLPEWLFYDAVDAIAGVPELFTVLGTLVNTTGLTETLQSEGPFTIFAPWDGVFTVEEIAAAVDAIANGEDPVGDFTNILTYHVFPGVAMSYDAMDGAEMEMANGEIATINIYPIYANATSNATMIMDGEDVAVMAEEREVIDAVYTINSIPIVAGDFFVANGVIHIIDGLMIPPSMLE